MTRPAAAELLLVPSEDTIIRMIHPEAAIDADGSVLQGALPSKEYRNTPNETSYGPSVYVASRLEAEVSTLEQATPNWRYYAVARCPVAAVRALGVRVCFSPDDCDIEAIKQAHATLLDVTVATRDQLIELFQKHLVRVGDGAALRAARPPRPLAP